MKESSVECWDLNRNVRGNHRDNPIVLGFHLAHNPRVQCGVAD